MSHPALGLPSLDLTHPVEDLVVLRTIHGGEDLLVGLDVVARSAGRLTCRVSGTLQQLHDLKLFTSLAVPLIDLASVRRSAERGLISALRCAGPPRFRIAPGTPDAGLLRTALVSELGWIEDPGDWAVNFVASPNGWEAEIGPLHWSRRFGRLERLPWSTKPVVGEILARLAKIRSGQRVVDPFCGTGTLLIAAARSAPDLAVFGADHDPSAIALAKANLNRCGVAASLTVASAHQLQHGDQSIDRVLANLPFGKLVGTHTGNTRLYPAALREVARVLHPSGRAVLLTDDKRLFRASVAAAPGLKIVRERRLSYGGVTPTVFCLIHARRKRLDPRC
jgi:tRNA (guanine6-N2)-methyltransferase